MRALIVCGIVVLASLDSCNCRSPRETRVGRSLRCQMRRQGSGHTCVRQKMHGRKEKEREVAILVRVQHQNGAAEHAAEEVARGIAAAWAKKVPTPTSPPSTPGKLGVPAGLAPASPNEAQNVALVPSRPMTRPTSGVVSTEGRNTK